MLKTGETKLIKQFRTRTQLFNFLTLPWIKAYNDLLDEQWTNKMD